MPGLRNSLSAPRTNLRIGYWWYAASSWSMTAFRRNPPLRPIGNGQRGGWLLVDRITGQISPINLPEFDAIYSAASWYRDYVAYCGVSDDGNKIYAVVAQISRHKPALKKLLDHESMAEGELKPSAPDSACPLPGWQRAPVHVTLSPREEPNKPSPFADRSWIY